jgi:hypothetical protein
VIITDIKASNGIIHVIDTVLLPPVTGQNKFVRITADADLTQVPGGASTGLSLAACKTVFLTDTVGGFGKVRDIGGWINLNKTVPIADTYGQPGGQPIPAECAFK